LNRGESVVIQDKYNKFDVAVETIPLKDARLQSSWGKQLFRIVLTARQIILEDAFLIKIEQ